MGPKAAYRLGFFALFHVKAVSQDGGFGNHDEGCFPFAFPGG